MEVSHPINPIVGIQNCSCEDDYILVSIVSASKESVMQPCFVNHRVIYVLLALKITTYTDASVCGLT